jgi:hypothetical protein
MKEYMFSNKGNLSHVLSRMGEFWEAKGSSPSVFSDFVENYLFFNRGLYDKFRFVDIGEEKRQA